MWNNSFVIQHRCKNSTVAVAKQPWVQAPLQLDRSALLCSVCSVTICFGLHWYPQLCSSETFLVFQLQPGKLSLGWKWKICSQSQQRADLYRQNSAPSNPCWFLNPIGPKGTVLIGQNGDTLIDWWRSWWCFSCSDWMEKASVLLVEIGFQELLHKGWLRMQKHSVSRQLSAGGSWFRAGFFLKFSFHEGPPCKNGCQPLLVLLLLLLF